MDSKAVFDWNDLRYFLAVARAGSTIAAAKVLGVSQSTVHRRLAEFESRVGRRLFKRQLTGYRLTEIGARLLPSAERAEEAMMAFERQSRASDEDLRGTVRVTCTATVADRISRSPLIAAFHTRYPGLQVELVITHRILDLSKGEADIAIRIGQPRDDALVGRKLMEVQRAVYASSSYVKRHGRPKSPEDLVDHFIVVYDGEVQNSDPARWVRSLAPRAKIAARSDNWPGLVTAIKSSIGLGALPVYIGDGERDLIRLMPVPELVTHVWLLMHPDLQRTPRVRAFFDFVVAEIAMFRALLLDQEEQSSDLIGTPRVAHETRRTATPRPATARRLVDSSRPR